MKTLTQISTGVVLAAAVASAPLAHATTTTLTPGGPVQAITGPANVTSDALISSLSGTASAGSVSADYTELVVADGGNRYGKDDLTFLVAVGNGNAAIQGVTISSIFTTPTSVDVGYIAGGGDFGADIPLSAQESSDGTVQFNFPDIDSILPGTGTEYLVLQTSATTLPSGNVGIISLIPAAPAPVATTPEPGALGLLGTGLLAVGGLSLRRRRRTEQ